MRKIDRRPPLLPAVALLAAVLAGCTHRVPAAPSVNLKSYGNLGIYQFSSDAQENLGPVATQEFIEAMQSAQPGTPVLELGLLRHQPDPPFLKQIKDQSGVDGVIVGNLEVSPVTPDIDISGSVSAMTVRADVAGTLTVTLYETETGATLWTRSASAHQSVAHAYISQKGGLNFASGNLDKAYGRLVSELVEKVSGDLRPH